MTGRIYYGLIMSWQPTAIQSTLVKRAKFVAQIRAFFHSRNILEVETPLLSRNTITDLHLDPFATNFEFAADENLTQLFLQTSPEFHMKRLLAAGSGPIFQICKAFRNEAAGTLHNPEFTMLEWYRPGFDDHQLMSELDELVQLLLNTNSAQKRTYQDVFQRFINIDPLTITLEQLKKTITKYSEDDWLQHESSRDTLLQWLFSMVIEPHLGDDRTPCFVYDFPASQAALAKINQSNNQVAHRFELYFKGTELANGYFELQDSKEQQRRFVLDNRQREAEGKPQRPADQFLLAALDSGLPSCAGVALGVDRLFMLATGLSTISQTLSFDINNA